VIQSSTLRFFNPVAARECGNWRVSTFNIISAREWLVDNTQATINALKFIATPGTITAGSVSIVENTLRITSNEQATYKFDLTIPHSIPAFGKIKI
jgi:hypothetical protein